MVSLAIAKALQVYGIAIVISMFVAVLIKVLVAVTGSVKKPAAAAAQKPQQASAKPAPVVQSGVPAEVVAAISGALAAALGPHRVLHIAETGRAWAHTGRSAQHSHQPRP